MGDVQLTACCQLPRRGSARRRAAHAILVILGLFGLTGCTGSLRPMTAQDHIQRGDTALASEELEKALEEFKRAVKLAPQMAHAHTKLGIAYKRTGKLEDAATSLETATTLDDKSYVSFFELGEVYRLLEKAAQAVKAYLTASRLEPRNPEPVLRVAGIYHQAGELDSATTAYENVLKLDPRSALAWSNLGAIHDTRGQTYEAIQAYKRSLECDTDQPVVLVNLATVYLNQDRLEAAQRTLESAIRMRDTLAVAHERMGYCHWRAGRYDDALLSYKQSVALDSKSARGYAGLGVVLMTQFLSSPNATNLRDQAIESWHTSLELDANQPKIRDLIDKYRSKPAAAAISLEG